MLHEHIDTALIDDESIPWIPFAPYADAIKLKVFKADPVRGEVIVLMKAPPDARLPRHHHSGTVVVYTTAGRWKYEEHDWIAGPGSVVFETAASTHTHQMISNDCDVLTFNIVTGDLIFMDDDGKVLAIENWRSMLQRYVAYCEKNCIEPRDITAFR